MFEAVPEEEIPSPLRLTRTLAVLALLGIAIVVFSYLGAFAVTTALVNADLLDKWPPGIDPRPRWMLMSLGYTSGTLCALAALLKLTSWLQLRRLDATGDDDAN